MLKQKRTAKTILKKKNEIEGLTLPNLKTYYKTILKQCDTGEITDALINGKLNRESRNRPTKI